MLQRLPKYIVKRSWDYLLKYLK